jgi:hypothetical protein
MLRLDGVDDDLASIRTIFARKYTNKSVLISLLPECIADILSRFDTHSEDVYFANQNAGYTRLQLEAVNLYKEHIIFGENHGNPAVRELAAEFKADMELAGQA